MREGNIVTLLVDKEHTDMGNISSGITGMIVGRSGELFTVDFGPNGQWYCTEEELRSESTESETRSDDNGNNEAEIEREAAPIYTIGSEEPIKKDSKLSSFEEDMENLTKE